MGTRGLLGHIVRSKNIRRAAYNHFDSYPSGLGADLARFIRGLTEEQLQKMSEMVAKIEWIANDTAPCPQALQDRYTALGFADQGVAGKRSDDWYCLLRHVQGAAALPHILDGTLGHLVDATAFEEDGLFCEWSYFVDWEERVVVVKKGHEREAVVGFGEVREGWMVGVERVASEEGMD